MIQTTVDARAWSFNLSPTHAVLTQFCVFSAPPCLACVAEVSTRVNGYWPKFNPTNLAFALSLLPATVSICSTHLFPVLVVRFAPAFLPSCLRGPQERISRLALVDVLQRHYQWGFKWLASGHCPFPDLRPVFSLEISGFCDTTALARWAPYA